MENIQSKEGCGKYYTETRPEMLSFVPPTAKSVLDVGCGEGGFGELVKKARAATVWGVEPNADAARRAGEKLDRVLVGRFEEADLGDATFDCIMFNDVLEHMYDPWSALRLARKHLTGTGVLVASLPNLAYFNVLWDLVVREEWRYEKAGTLDITHIRFFTRKGMIRLFSESGYIVRRIEGINPQVQGRKFKLINALFLNRLARMRYLQFAVVAEPGGGSGDEDGPGHHFS
jgi:2-polyprenyl-3-methyl-5-hydroxy-6-metoxy-1,4-benzoquinol methylase